MATPDEVLKSLMVIMPLFANYHPPETDEAVHTLKVAWHRQVGHMDKELLNLALADAAGQSEFFPTPMRVLESAARITQPEMRTGEEAWGDVLKAVGEFGYLHEPGTTWTFKDPLTLAVVNQLGWRRLCLEEDDTLEWQFIHAYKALAERGAREARELPAVTEARKLIEAGNEAKRLLASQQWTQLVAGKLSAKR